MRVTTLSEEQLQEARRLWTEEPTTATEIGLRFGVSKNTIIGLAHRRGWLRHGRTPPPKPTPASPSQRVVLRTCQWIEGDVAGDHSYCGEIVVPGSAWCRHHFVMAYKDGEEMLYNHIMRQDPGAVHKYLEKINAEIVGQAIQTRA